MAEEIAFKKGRISNFEALVTLTLDRVILHTVMHHSLTSTYTPNFIEIEETFCGRTDVMDGHLRPRLIRSTVLKSRPNRPMRTHYRPEASTGPPFSSSTWARRFTSLYPGGKPPYFCENRHGLLQKVVIYGWIPWTSCNNFWVDNQQATVILKFKMASKMAAIF